MIIFIKKSVIKNQEFTSQPILEKPIKLTSSPQPDTKQVLPLVMKTHTYPTPKLPVWHRVKKRLDIISS